MTRREETARVKLALARAGIRAQVTHGRGTAHGWLDIETTLAPVQGCTCTAESVQRDGRCRRCSETYRAMHDMLMSIARSASNRADEWDCHITINIRFGGEV